MEKQDVAPAQQKSAGTVPSRRWRKGQKDTVKKYRQLYTDYRDARGGSCYWPALGVGGNNWLDKWDQQEKVYTQYCELPAEDDYRSNVKSPMTFGRVEMTMQKLRGQPLGFLVTPGAPEDKRKALLTELIMNAWEQNTAVGASLFTAEKDAVIHGCSFPKITYIKKTRKVQIPLTSATKMTKKEKARLKEGETIYREVEIDDFDDIAITPTKIQSIYVDPAARNLHGVEYDAQAVVERMLPSLEQFKAMYENDSEAQNVDLVKAGSAYEDTGDMEFFKPPKDVDVQDYVELLHVWDKKNDRYAVLANDVVIKDIPLPYIHKQLPYIKLSAIENPHQFYDIGLPDTLIALQSEEEQLKNMIYDYLHITGNPMMTVVKNIYGEFSRQYTEGRPGLLLPVRTNDDVKPLAFPAMNFDFWRAIEGINKDAVMCTQLDPSQLGVVQKYVSATSAMATREIVDAFINNLLKSFSAGLTVAAYQVYELMKQYYTVPRVEKIAGETLKKAYRKMALHGVKINTDTMEIKKTGPGTMDSVEIKEDFFDTEAKVDIRIRPEALEVMSPAIEAQKMETALAQLAPFMADPTSEKSMATVPLPIIDARRAVEKYIETHKIPADIVISPAEDEDVEIRRAELQGKEILDGGDIQGIPGEGYAHKLIHYKQLAGVQEEVVDVQNRMMRGELPPRDYQAAEELQTIVSALAKHLETDNMPKGAEAQVGMAMAQPAVPPDATGGSPAVPMPAGLTPQGGNGAPVPMGGNQMMGGPPIMGGAGGQGGRPPMMESGLPNM